MRLTQQLTLRSLVRVSTWLMLLTVFVGCSDSDHNSSVAVEEEDDGDTTVVETTRALTGGGIKGPLANAVVTVYSIDTTATGFKGSVVGSGSTDAQAQ
ncbi:MAG: hypothetical protein KUG76_05850, partial [Gammaproteobacteria bacterium]|nr:hypothetical protein [Gammaproteobacteria bacterium]